MRSTPGRGAPFYLVLHMYLYTQIAGESLSLTPMSIGTLNVSEAREWHR